MNLSIRNSNIDITIPVLSFDVEHNVAQQMHGNYVINGPHSTRIEATIATEIPQGDWENLFNTSQTLGIHLDGGLFTFESCRPISCNWMDDEDDETGIRIAITWITYGNYTALNTPVVKKQELPKLDWKLFGF
jgi:hypothetical protein